MTSRAQSAAAVLLALAWVTGEAAASSTARRYECRFADGATAIVAHDLSAQYGRAVAQCTPLEAAVARAEPLPVRPLPPEEAAAEGWGGGARPAGRDSHQLMASPYAQLISEAARRHRVEPRLLMAMAQVESRHRADARSPKGAIGVMQIMPGTGARYGIAQTQNLFDPEINIDVGARYLSDLLDMFGGRVDLAVAAYNAGEATIARYGNRIPPFPETRDYVKRVLELAGWRK